MKKPQFNKLWTSYPRDNAPCDGPWSNQCAIRLSLALNGEGTIKVDSLSYSEPKCAHGHARGAESLANWLQQKHLGQPLIFTTPQNAKEKLKSKQGIIFFKDCFARGNESWVNRRGDHIDLWREGKAKTFDDPSNASKEVRFWELV